MNVVQWAPPRLAAMQAIKSMTEFSIFPALMHKQVSLS